MEAELHPLTEHGTKLMHILRSQGGWLSRATIAAQLGKARLNGYDLTMLDFFTACGLIEARKVRGGASKGHVWEYQVIEPEEHDAGAPKPEC